MKKLLIAFIFMGIAVTVFYACKKDTDKMQINTNSEQQYSAYEWEVYYKLQTFKNKIESPLKTDDYISQDSVVWYIETLLNSTEVDSDASFTYFFRDSTNYQIPINSDGLVNMSDISTVYNQMVDTLSHHLGLINFNNKFVFLTDVEKTDENSATMFLSLEGIYGANPNVLYIYEDFEDIDDWYYGNMLGRNDGAYIGESDAGFELERRLNNPSYAWAPGTVWGDVSEDHYAPHFDYPTTTNPYGDFRIFCDNISTTDPILLNEHLDYYLNEAHWILNTVDDPSTPDIKEGLRPSEYLSFKFVDVKTSNPNSTPYYHYYVAIYGHPYLLPPFE